MKKNLYQEKGNGISGGTVSKAAEVETVISDMQRKLEEMQRVAERNTQAMYEAVDSIIQIDSAKNIIFYNKSAEKMFGFTREEVMGRNVKMIVPIEHQANHDQYVDSNVKTGVNKVVGVGRDLEATKKDGTRSGSIFLLAKPWWKVTHSSLLSSRILPSRKEQHLKLMTCSVN